MGICPWLVLVSTARVNDTAAPGFQLRGDCIDYWADIRRKK